MNVALTRACFSLWIVGHCETLRRSPNWSALITYAEEHKLLTLVPDTFAPLRWAKLVESGEVADD